MFLPDVPTFPSPRTPRSITSIDRRRWRRWSKSCLTHPPEESPHPKETRAAMPEPLPPPARAALSLVVSKQCFVQRRELTYLCNLATSAQHFRQIKRELWVNLRAGLLWWCLLTDTDIHTYRNLTHLLFVTGSQSEESWVNGWGGETADFRLKTKELLGTC